MFELNCLYPTGEKVIAFVQWDLNQTIIIDGSFDLAPQVHFCNKNSEKAICIQSKLMANKQIKVEVPNTLLIEPFPIMIYVYLIDGSNSRTILSDQITVIPRLQPNDFEYVENVHVVHLVELEAAIQDCITAADKANTAADKALEIVNGNISNKTVSFTAATSRTNIVNGETLSTLFGKIQKYLGDLKASAYADIANNLTTTSSGLVLDARQGKILYDSIKDEVTENDIDTIFTNT